MSKIFAFIPARSGSKGIKDKNLRKIGGKTLTRLAVDFACECGFFDRIILSSDSDVILNEGSGKDIWLDRRPVGHSDDSATIGNAVIDFIDRTQEILPIRDDDWIVLIEPTSPFRQLGQATTLRNIISKNTADSVVFVKAHAPVLWRKTGAGWEKVMKEGLSSNRQDRDTIFTEVNCFFATRVRHLRMAKNFSSGICECVPISDEVYGIDINTQLDLVVADHLWNQKDVLFS